VRQLLLPLSRLLVVGPVAHLVTESTSAFAVISQSLSMGAWYLLNTIVAFCQLLLKLLCFAYFLFNDEVSGRTCVISNFHFGLIFTEEQGQFIWKLFLFYPIKNARFDLESQHEHLILLTLLRALYYIAHLSNKCNLL